MADSPIDWNKAEATRAVREYSGGTRCKHTPENHPQLTPKRISPTNPSARWTAAPGGPAFYAYSTNYLIDLRAGIIMDVEATPAYRSQEVDSARTMIDRVEQRLQLKPQRLVGDTAYGTASLLGWMVEEKAIEPHVPVWDKSQRQDETFSSGDFQWNDAANEYRCPQGRALRSASRFKGPHNPVTKDNTIIYRASPTDCSKCALKEPMLSEHASAPNPNAASTKPREKSLEESQRLAEYRQSRRKRKKVKRLFAHLKRVLRLDRLSYEGSPGAQDEFLMAATAQNLRRMAKWLTLGVERNGNGGKPEATSARRSATLRRKG